MSTQAIRNERTRRSSILQALLGADFEPNFDDDESYDPNNVPDLALEQYNSLAALPLYQPDPHHDDDESGGGAATLDDRAPGDTLNKLLERLVAIQDRKDLDRSTISQKDAAALIAAVPPVAADGVALSGAKLLSWFKKLTGYLEDRFWTTAYAFNSTEKLFTDAPHLLATWQRVTQSDAAIVQLRAEKRFREAWTLVADAMITAHAGDKHAFHRKALSVRSALSQTGSKTVAETATGLTEEMQCRDELNLFDGIKTLLKDVLANAKIKPPVSLMGFDLSTDPDGTPLHREHQALHAHVVSVLRTYVDRAQALELYGALRSEIQTYLEDEIGSSLLSHTADLSTVRALALQFETREKNQKADAARLLRSLGVELPKPNGNGKGKAPVKQTTGNPTRGTPRQPGKGRNGRKGKGKGGDDAAAAGPPVAGLDGVIKDWIRCYGCNRNGHVKMKDGKVNCPTWKPDVQAPKATVQQAAGTPAVTSDSETGESLIDADALFAALGEWEGDGDSEGARAVLKQLYAKHTSKGAKAKMVHHARRSTGLIRYSMTQRPSALRA